MPDSPHCVIAPLFRLCAAAALCVLTSACTAPAQRGDTPQAAATVSQTRTGADIADLRTADDYRGAAQRLLAQAAQTQPPEREEQQLTAAELLLHGALIDEAATVLVKLPAGGSSDYQTRRALAEARVLLVRAQPQPALQRLAASSEDIAPARMVEFHRLRAAAYTAAGNPLEAARERVWLDGLLPEAERAENHQAIWESLARLSDNMLVSMRTAPAPDVFSGWMELVETTRAVRDNPQQLDIALAIWRERYPQHPAAATFISDMQSRLIEYSEAATASVQIAVLLPLTGPLAEAGQAVRDGMLTAHFQSASSATQRLRFYDTGANAAQQVWSLYQQAVKDGAQQVIGPLTKEAAAALAGAGPLTVPVLALNTLSDTDATPDSFYQFGLAPEDEAIQVAERAWRDGQRTALALTPESAWGERVYQAFAQHWRSLGGNLLKHQAYGDDDRGYSNSVRDLLQVYAGAAGDQALTRQPGQPPALAGQARQDVGFVFLAANAPQARMLRPLLRYHDAGVLPVYATSQVYEGFSNTTLDRDLDGIRFCDMPWMLPSAHPLAGLRVEIARLWPARHQRYARLYALGIDALSIAPHLQGLRDGSYSRHPGVSGDLYLDPDRRIHRDLQWAEFSNGTPTALPDLPAAPPAQNAPPQSSPTQDHLDAYPASAAAPGAGLAR